MHVLVVQERRVELHVIVHPSDICFFGSSSGHVYMEGRRKPADRVFAPASNGCREEIELHRPAASLKIEIATSGSPGMAMVLEKLLVGEKQRLACRRF